MTANPNQATPNVESAVVTARVISRKLRKAGFPMSIVSDSKRWMEGFRVSRVGCSCTVSIDYHVTTYPGSVFHTPEVSARVSEMMAKAKAWVLENGYPLDPNFSGGLYIRCERPE